MYVVEETGGGSSSGSSNSNSKSGGQGRVCIKVPKKI